MPSKARNYKKEYKRKLELMSDKPGAIDAERVRVKHAQRKRRKDVGLKKHEREYARKRREDPEHLAKCRRYFTEWRHRRVSECRAIIHEWKRQGCCVCGESALCCIDAHHKNQSEKEHNIGQLVYGAKALTAIPKELDKCIPICSNCHKKYHAGEDKEVVSAVVAITGQPWMPVEGHGIRNGKKERKRIEQRGPFGGRIYKEDDES